MAFDTLKFVRKLESSGIAREQATSIAEAIADASHEQGEALATKTDLIGFKSEVQSDLMNFRSEFQTEIMGLKSSIQRIDLRMEQLELRMTVKLGGMLVVAIGVFVALSRFS